MHFMYGTVELKKHHFAVGLAIALIHTIVVENIPMEETADNHEPSSFPQWVCFDDGLCKIRAIDDVTSSPSRQRTAVCAKINKNRENRFGAATPCGTICNGHSMFRAGDGDMISRFQ
jgi:hypothetical protein